MGRGVFVAPPHNLYLPTIPKLPPFLMDPSFFPSIAYLHRFIAIELYQPFLSHTLHTLLYTSRLFFLFYTPPNSYLLHHPSYRYQPALITFYSVPSETFIPFCLFGSWSINRFGFVFLLINYYFLTAKLLTGCIYPTILAIHSIRRAKRYRQFSWV